MLIYRIRNRDGLFSNGGSHPRFTKKGKIWQSSGAFNNHLNILSNSAIQMYRDQGAEVVSYEIVESEVMVETFQECLDARNKKKAEKNAAYAERIKAILRARDEAEFQRLRKLLGKE